MSKKILGMGNAVLDILTKVEDNFIISNNLQKGAMQIVTEEESEAVLKKIEIIKSDSGGSVANTIAAIAMLGGHSNFCGKVKEDKLGMEFENKMEDAGSNFLCKKSMDGLPTARCIVFVTSDGERTMQTFLGASTTLSENDLEKAFFENTDYLLIEGYLWSSETARKAINKAIRFCNDNNIKVVFSLSDKNLVRAFKKDFIEFISENVSILMGNEGEFLELCDANTTLLKKLPKNFNLELAIITKGKDGALVVNKKEDFHIDSYDVENVIDTTGAGDMFAAGFLYKLTNGSPAVESARFGCKLASLIIQQYGARLEQKALKKII